MPDVTRLLDAAAAGDPKAAAGLLPLVYDELRQLSAARMAAEPVPLLNVVVRRWVLHGTEVGGDHAE